MHKLFFLLVPLFIYQNTYGSEATARFPEARKRKYDAFTQTISTQEHFDKALKLYEKFRHKPQRISKRIIYKNDSIDHFYKVLSDPHISTRLLHKSLFYLQYLSKFTPTQSIEKLLLRTDANIEDYSLALQLLRTTSRFDLYDIALEKILAQQEIMLYDLTSNDYLERPLSPVLWQRICEHPDAGTKTLIKYAIKLKFLAPEVARQAFAKAALIKNSSADQNQKSKSIY